MGWCSPQKSSPLTQGQLRSVAAPSLVLKNRLAETTGKGVGGKRLHSAWSAPSTGKAHLHVPHVSVMAGLGGGEAARVSIFKDRNPRLLSRNQIALGSNHSVHEIDAKLC
jgi:hypothetical protein